MNANPVVVSLTEEEIIRLEMICVDGDKDGALAFLRTLRARIGQIGKGMRSHLEK
jgi:lactam utilization protein B